MGSQQRAGATAASHGVIRVVLLADALAPGIPAAVQIRQALQFAGAIGRPGVLSVVTANGAIGATMQEQLQVLPDSQLFRQPQDRGTGVATLVPLLQVGRAVTGARVVVLTVAGAMAYGAGLAGAVHRTLGGVGSARQPLHMLCAEPSRERVVLVGEVGALLARYRSCCPEVVAMLDTGPAVAAWRDARALPELERIYALLPDVDLCRDVLEGTGVDRPQPHAQCPAGAVSPRQFQLTGDGY